MLTQTAPNSVKSSDGFRISIIKRYELEYVDENGRLVVPIEPMADAELVVSVSTIAAASRGAISERIGEALRFLKIAYRFD